MTLCFFSFLGPSSSRATFLGFGILVSSFFLFFGSSSSSSFRPTFFFFSSLDPRFSIRTSASSSSFFFALPFLMRSKVRSSSLTAKSKSVDVINFSNCSAVLSRLNIVPASSFIRCFSLLAAAVSIEASSISLRYERERNFFLLRWVFPVGERRTLIEVLFFGIPFSRILFRAKWSESWFL